MKVKIAIFEPNFLTPKPLAFSSTVLLQSQVQYFQELGAEVIVLAEGWKDEVGMSSANNSKKMYILRGKLTRLRALFLLTDQLISMPPPVFSLDTGFQAARILKNSGIDIIYGCGSSFSSIFTAMLGYMTGIPTVYYVFHTPPKRWWKAAIMEGYDMPLSYILSNFVKDAIQNLPRRGFLIKWSLKNITKVIASSAFVRNTLCTFGLNKKDVSIIYPSIKLPTSQAPKEDGAPVITYFGNMWWGRGALDIVKAFYHISKRYPEAKLMLATSNSHTITQHYFNDIVDKYNLESHIIQKGIVEDVYTDVLVPSTVVVLPYRGSPSIKLIEAMASAKPIVTTNVEWAPELVVDGFNGFLTKVGDIAGLTEKVEMILNNPELAKKLGKNARRTVETKCNLDCNTRTLIDILTATKEKGRNNLRCFLK